MLARKLAQNQSQPKFDIDPAQQSMQVAHLQQVSLFAELKDEPGALERLSQAMVLKSFPPGTPIITEGETGAELFLLIQGQASVYKTTAEGEHYKVAILNGDHRPFFGEGGLLDADSRSATIKADTPCQCLVLDQTGFESFSIAYPQWALPVLMRIARAVMARLRKGNEDQMLLYNALVAEIRGH